MPLSPLLQGNTLWYNTVLEMGSQMPVNPAENQSAGHPSLRRRLIIHITLMIVGLVVLSCAAAIGINSLHHRMEDALAGYQQLRTMYEIGQQAAYARAEWTEEPPNIPAAHAAIRSALLHLETSPEIQSEKLHADLADTVADLKPEKIDNVLGQIATLSSDIRTNIVMAQQAADQRRWFTLWTVISLAILVVISGTIVGVQQYRAVMRPLRRLGNAVRTVAGRNFHQPIEAAGDREFVALAEDFNGMARQLDSLYRNLEQQVAAKSKELVRSERLASVGFLAAGVAHEINNPLSIITGYGERALRQLEAEANPTTDRTRKAISVMCEEAYRCKQITDRLLSLARPGSETFTTVSLSGLVEEVISNVTALPEYRDRAISFETDPRESLTIHARDGEIKQVVLNLLINALEATPAIGRVNISLAPSDGFVELSVTDNGRGMKSDTLDRVFEPFFTHKRGATRGTGLGLSITHAIVTDHGGTIRAHSDGLGAGSRFVVRLPMANKGVQDVHR